MKHTLSTGIHCVSVQPIPARDRLHTQGEGHQDSPHLPPQHKMAMGDGGVARRRPRLKERQKDIPLPLRTS